LKSLSKNQRPLVRVPLSSGEHIRPPKKKPHRSGAFFSQLVFTSFRPYPGYHQALRLFSARREWSAARSAIAANGGATIVRRLRVVEGGESGYDVRHQLQAAP